MKDTVTYLYRNNHLTKKQYGFRIYGSTADVFTVVTRRISDALDGVLDLSFTRFTKSSCHANSPVMASPIEYMHLSCPSYGGHKINVLNAQSS